MPYEEKIAHLGFIQDVINRMANNSFLIKGWVVTLLAALFALAGDKFDKNMIPYGALPMLFFWGLDGYYLYQERIFRALYKLVATDQVPSNQFTMDAKATGRIAICYGGVFFSRTLFLFYGLIIATTEGMFYFFLK